MLDVRLFRNPRFSAASAAIALSFFGLFGFIFMITQYFQIVRGYDPLGAGLATLPFAFVTAGFSPVAMLLMRRFGTKLVVAAGLTMMSAGFVVAATTAVDSPYWGKVIIAMALMAAGLGLTTGPATEAIMGALPPGKAGAGSAVNDTTREVGGTLGVAIVGSVLNSAYGSHVLSSLTALGAPAATGHLAGQSVVAGMNVASQFPAPLRDAAAGGGAVRVHHRPAPRLPGRRGHRPGRRAGGAGLRAGAQRVSRRQRRPGPRPNGGGGLRPLHDPEQRLAHREQRPGRASYEGRPGRVMLVAYPPGDRTLRVAGMLSRRSLFSLETALRNALAERTGTCQAPVNSAHSSPNASSAGKPGSRGCADWSIRSRRQARSCW